VPNVYDKMIKNEGINKADTKQDSARFVEGRYLLNAQQSQN
jgi:hypothetical protein